MTETAGVLLKIPKIKAELPVLIVLVVMDLVGFALHYGIFGIGGGLIWFAVTLPLILWLYLKRRGDYFVKVDDAGISWRQHFFSKYIFIPWNYLQRIDYLEYEINFMIKESAQVVCFPTSGLEDEEAELLKESITKMVEKHGSSPS